MRKAFRSWFGLSIELLQVDCRHCRGKGVCTGTQEHHGKSCASCLMAIGLNPKEHMNVRCEVCQGRGVFVYLPLEASLGAKRDSLHVYEVAPTTDPAHQHRQMKPAALDPAPPIEAKALPQPEGAQA